MENHKPKVNKEYFLMSHFKTMYSNGKLLKSLGISKTYRKKIIKEYDRCLNRIIQAPRILNYVLKDLEENQMQITPKIISNKVNEMYLEIETYNSIFNNNFI